MNLGSVTNLRSSWRQLSRVGPDDALSLSMDCCTILVVIVIIGMMCLLLGYRTLVNQLLPVLVDAADAHEVVLVLVRDHNLLVRVVQHQLPDTSLILANSVRLVWVLIVCPERLLLQGIWNTADNTRLLKWILREML